MIQTQQNTFVLFTLFKLNLDEHKTLTKISTCKPLTTVPQTSTRFGHEGTRKPAKLQRNRPKVLCTIQWTKTGKKHFALDKYLIDNPQQHQYFMSPDSEYISLNSYATKLEINLCNFPAIWVVLSILLDPKSNDLQYVQNLQQVVNNYYDMHTMETMRWLEQQASEILDVMYDSVNKQNF